MKHEPNITNGAIRLRRCLPADAEPVFEAVRESIAEIALWMPWCHPGYSLDDSRVWFDSRASAWEKGTDFDFIIVNEVDGFPLGACGLNHINVEEKYANLGYWVRTRRTGQGIATAIVPMLARFAFDNLKLNRVEIVVAKGNLPSQRVAEKAGAQREGLLRRRLVVRDQVLDAFMYSLIPEDLVRR